MGGDPITKRAIIEKGPAYFDPSLPTVEDSNRLEEERQKKLGKMRAALETHNLIQNDIVLMNDLDQALDVLVEMLMQPVQVDLW